MTLEELFRKAVDTHGDIHEHIPTLRRFAEQCSHVTEFGTRWATSTIAFIAARPKRLVCYDVQRCDEVGDREQTARDAGVDFQFHQADVLTVDIEPTDLLFIDTKHTYDQLKSELERHADKARKFIILHDTVSFGLVGEDGGKGLNAAADEYFASVSGWSLIENSPNCNGLRVYARK